jgi:phosphohistidine swiveling domain-containing protein
MSAPAQIPVPDGLAMPWETEDDARMFWTPDLMHQPYPMSMVDFELSRRLNDHSFSHGLATYDVPMRMHSRRFWTYQYGAMTPLPVSEAEMQSMATSSEQKLKDAIAQLDTRWQTVWLPEVKEHITYWDSFPLGSVSVEELSAHLEDTLTRNDRVWDIHFEVAFPMMLAISLFDEMYKDLFQPDSPLRAFKLLQGFDNKTLEADRALWKLSRSVLANQQVRDIFESSSPEEVVPALQRLPEAQEFLAELDTYLDEYGRRGDHWSIASPTWRENPITVIWNLQDYVAQKDRNPDLELAALIAERDQLTAEAREQIAAYPEAVRQQFEFLLKAAQTGNVLTEDHGWWIDFRALACVREVFVELGRRFTSAGVIEEPNDVFHLTLDEVRAAILNLDEADFRHVVQQRKDEMALYAAIQPPPAVGTPPPGPPPDSPLTRMMGKFFGTPPEPSEDSSTIHGAAGSSGVVRGTARVVRTLSDAARLKTGEILVTQTTAPPWTPLFATAAAVVTDTGGILSHCAVVAREYGIPAVVGTGVGTSMIGDGQLIEVDGDRGVVRIIDDESASSAATGQPEHQPVPVPENFPVNWQHPGDERVFWMHERMHWPDPLTMLDYEFMREAHVEFGGALADYGVPLQYNVRFINYYWYSAIGPSIDNLSEMPARMEAGIGNVADTTRRLQQLWTTEWLPEVQQHLEYLSGFDLAGADMTDLLAHLDETCKRHSRLWRIHFLQTFPTYMAMSSFDDLYQDLFGSEHALDAYRLMQGFENKTVEIGRAMWRLSRQALASADVRASFETLSAKEVIPALSQSGDGRAFLDELQKFLETYGQRGEKLGVSYPSWIEDPTPVVQNIQEYVSQPEMDFDAETARLAAEREQAIAEALETIESYPQPVIDQFEAMLTHAQQATVISEDHTYYIDFASMYLIRRVLLEFGSRFASAGVLDSADDVFMLTLEEMRESAGDLAASRRQDIVAERRAELEHFRAISPPPVLGTPAPPPPEDPLSRTVGRFFGAPPPAPEVTGGMLVLRGSAGSSGKVSGTARVITSLDDANRLGRGDILVAPTTAPAWTPLFATAAAVVTDTGGVLSHCAVVAREYGIPAVVGTGAATAMIVDGQTIEVDGDLGTVRVIG